MKYDKLDTVTVLSGKYKGATGQVVGASQIHRNSIPDMAEYQVQFKSIKVTEEFKEDNLILVEKYDPAKAEAERQEAIAKQKAESEKLAEEKMADSLRKKIEKEFEIRAQVEAEYAAKKAAQNGSTNG